MGLATLAYGLLLVGLCNCNDPELEKSDTHSTKNLQEDQVTLSSVESALPHAIPPTTLHSIDVAAPDSAHCESFDFYLDAVPTKLVVAKDESADKVLYGKHNVWAAQSGEVVGYVQAYMDRDDGPKFVHVVTRAPGVVMGRMFEYSSGKWNVVEGDYSEKLRSLRVVPDSLSNFVLDLDVEESTDKCKIFQTKLVGLNTRLYFPKLGHYASSVGGGGKDVWKADGDERVMHCDVYTGGNGKSLLLLVASDDNGEHSHFFEKVNGEWDVVDHGAFQEKFLEMQNEQI